MKNRSYNIAAPAAQRKHDENYVRILDTTLRDGDQSPGVALSTSQKLEIAQQLAKLKVDIIDAGFPASSPAEAEAVMRIASTIGRTSDEDGHVPVICALSRCIKEDIAAAWEAVRGAEKGRILLFISTSDIHMKHKLNKTAEEVVNIAAEMVAFARSLGCKDVQFGAEDSGRTRLELLYDIFEKVIKAGATTVGIGDTVGYMFPSEVGEMTRKVRANTRGIENVVLTLHCHNDLELATSNTLAGAIAGARQVEVTINGIGERAGNASLEEVVMAMRCRGDMVKGLFTGIDTSHIFPTSEMVAEYTGMIVQPHKAIVGANAFSHQSGIHQDGLLKHRSTYEIMSPADIGITKNEQDGIILGKHSGRHALDSRLKQLGFELPRNAMDEVFPKFKEYAKAKKVVTNAELIELIISMKLC